MFSPAFTTTIETRPGMAGWNRIFQISIPSFDDSTAGVLGPLDERRLAEATHTMPTRYIQHERGDPNPL